MKISNVVIIGVLCGVLGILMFVVVSFNGFPSWFTISQKWNWMALSALITSGGLSLIVLSKYYWSDFK